MELRAASADTSCPHHRPRHAREHDGGHHGHAPSSIGEVTGGHRPCDQGEAQERDRGDVEQHPHPGFRDRLVDHEPGHRQRDDDQDDGADALGPRRPAEQQPPDDDGESSQGSAHDREHPDRQGEQFGVRRNLRHDEHEQPLQSHDDHAGPQPERSPRQSFVVIGGGHWDPSAVTSGAAARTMPRMVRLARTRQSQYNMTAIGSSTATA